MTSNYLDMTLLDFLDTITEKKQEYSLKIGRECEYIGTKSEFQDLLSEVSAEEYSEISTLFLDKEEYTTPFDLTSIEIYNYLEKVTSNFNLTKVKLILQEIEMYRCMVFNDRINEESLNIYMKNEWMIPKIEFNPIFPKGASYVKVPDYHTMTRKTHLCASWHIDHAISLLKDTQLNEAISETISETFQKTTDRGGSLSSLIESPHLNGWVPKLPLSDNYIEGSQPVANRFRPDGPNWELINAGLKEGWEANEKQQFEITKRAYIEAMKEINANQSKVLKLVDEGENIIGSNTEQLKVKQIALIHVYQGPPITGDNKSEIAEGYGYTKKNSGHGLYDDYNHFLNKNNRRADPDSLTKRSWVSKIGWFENALPHLTTESAKKMAIEDIQVLKDNYKNAFP